MSSIVLNKDQKVLLITILQTGQITEDQRMRLIGCLSSDPKDLDLSKLSDEELREFYNILLKARKDG